MGRVHTRLMPLLTPLWLAWLVPLPAMADSMHCNGYIIEYTSFDSTIIPPKVAAAHGIVRSRNRVIANVTVLRDGKSVAAKVTGTATNLLNQTTSLSFEPVREKGTVYYLATQVVSRRDTIRYAIDVTPAGRKQVCRFHFIRDYYRAGS